MIAISGASRRESCDGFRKAGNHLGNWEIPFQGAIDIGMTEFGSRSRESREGVRRRLCVCRVSESQ